MKKLVVILFFLVSPNVFANTIDVATAKTVGFNFITTKTQSTKQSNVTSLNLVYIGKDSLTSPSPCFYVFNTLPSKGFVIVAADDNASPVLGYSSESDFNPSKIPVQLNDWIKGYTRDIANIIHNNITASLKIKSSWQELLNPTKHQTASPFGILTSVSPMVNVHWNQTAYYNKLCPNNSLTGCVATAMAQLMKYWNYPTKGTGYHSYNDVKSGVHSASFSSTTYQWASMPTGLSASSTLTQVNAVATLMYHCGVSVEMQYSPSNSTSYMIGGGYDAEYALKSFFGYSDSLKALTKTDYNDANWLNLIETELSAGRPIMWDGHEPSGLGHCFIADGYDVNNMIHFNWGWDGQCDGYYNINSLNPAMYPIGFNSLEHILVNIRPSYNTYNLSLSSAVSATQTVAYGMPVAINTNIINTGTSPFSGDFCAAVFDTSLNFTSYIQRFSSLTLKSDSSFKNGIVFTNKDSTPINPGVYSVYVYYRPPGGHWVNLVSNGNFPNFITITVVNSSIVPDTIYTTKNATVCSSQLPYSWNGNLYNQSGTYTGIISSINDTTTIGTLNLTVKNSSYSITNVDICSSKLPFKWNGSSYNASGTYSKTLVNSVGCDSLATLILYVNNIVPTTTTTPISGCGSAVYNGRTYTSNTTLRDTLKTTDGCDSVYHTVTITLNSPLYPTVSITASAKNINAGTPVTFNATTTNAGTVAIYQWRINSAYVNSASASTFIIDSLKNNDTISCVFITVNPCGKVSTVVSNQIIIKVVDQYSVSGTILNPLGTGINKVLVGLNNTDSLFSSAYHFTLASNGSYTIRPHKNNDVVKANGVSVLDVILIQKHILGKTLLSSPYKIIAADVNNDGTVSVADIINIKRLILGKDTTFPGSRLWAFVDSAYQFPNSANPFPFKDSILVDKPAVNLSNQSFIGLKLGDVSYDWDATVAGIATKPQQAISLVYQMVYYSNQTEVRVPVRVKDFKDLVGCQFTLNFDANAMQLKSIPQNLLNIQYNTALSNEGKISFVWNDATTTPQTLADSTLLMELVFAIQGQVPSNNILSISSDIASVAAYDAHLIKHKITIEPAGQSTVSSNQLIVFPNPAIKTITIKGNHIAAVSVVDNLGRTISAQAFHDDTNPIINVNHLASGCYHLLIQTTNGKVNVVGFVKQ